MNPSDLLRRGYINTLSSKKFDLVPNWNFYVDFKDVLIKFLKINKKFDYSYYMVPILVRGIKFPELQFQEKQFSGKNTEIKYPSILNLDGNLIIKFYPDNRYIGLSFHYEWVQLMVNLSTMIKYAPSRYLSDIKIYIYDRNGKKIQTRTLYDCYPSMIETGEFDKMNLDYHDIYTMSVVVTGGMKIELH